jgi:hypothetical protein
MTEVMVKFDVTDPGGAKRAHFDGIPLQFTNGECNKKLSTGEHAFTWFVSAATGSKYSISIKMGKQELFTHTAMLDETLRDGGIQWITVG